MWEEPNGIPSHISLMFLHPFDEGGDSCWVGPLSSQPTKISWHLEQCQAHGIFSINNFLVWMNECMREWFLLNQNWQQCNLAWCYRHPEWPHRQLEGTLSISKLQLGQVLHALKIPFTNDSQEKGHCECMQPSQHRTARTFVPTSGSWVSMEGK